MKRAVLVAAGTVAGVAAVLALNPQAGSATAAKAHAAASGSSTSTGSGSSGSTSTAATYAGDTVDVGRNYGSVQVQISVSGGRVTDITALAVPQNDPRSAQISQYAVPQLVSQALAAQSASIAGISGATYTSQGFMQSLASALTAAGIG